MLLPLGPLSYITIDTIPEHLKQHALDHFQEMFEQHPKKRHTILLTDDETPKELKVERWQQSYFNTPKYIETRYDKRTFMYSREEKEFPECFQPYYKYMKSIDERYNQVVANWYKDGQDYIAFHSDCTIGMIPNGKISIISLYDSTACENERTFSLKQKSFIKNIDKNTLDIRMNHGSIITMCGDTQKEYRHGIRKSTHTTPRISLSFRQMI